MTRLLAIFCGVALAAGPALAHHVGVFVPKDDQITLNFKQIKASARAGRFDVAARLFDEGSVHDVMERYERRLPPALEDGLRASLRAGDLPGAELRLSIFLAFLTGERIRDALGKLSEPGVASGERREQGRKILNAAWRYYNLADFVVSMQNPRAAVAVRMAFEDAQTYLGGMLVDPMWAAGSNPCNPRPLRAPGQTGPGVASTARPAEPDEGRTVVILGQILENIERFIADGAAVARAGAARRFLPPR